MKNTILILYIFISIASCAQNSSIDWRADIDYLKTELPKKHYNLFMVKSQQDFNNGLDRIAAQKNELSDFEIAVKLQQLIASMGDMHTSVSLKPFFDFNRMLPLGLMWFNDGIFVQTTTRDNEAILGGKLLKVNGTPVNTVIDSLSTITTIDNQATVKKIIPETLPAIQLLEYYGFADSDTVELQIENENGDIINYNIKPERINRSNAVRVLPEPLPLCYQNGRDLFWDKIVKDNNVYYIQYKQCWSREHVPSGFRGNVQDLPSFTEFQNRIIDTIKANNFDKIIFDIRFNGGGNSDQGTQLIKELSTLKKANKKGKLYVIIGRKTFSSAIINAMDFRNMTNAILVGEETSGKPNHLGEVKRMQLPSSGLSVQYSTKYFKRTDKDLKTITPDHIIEASFKDFKEGRDPFYEWIVSQ
ncbi:S41 family peptidase [Saccharicrinis sp. FJH62]|uniref:S41 family peptidase n=1 Tax=Saccharicrinis sp. FJH62 TaxID=3344657 RepID=UPI0035D3F070